VLDPSEPLARYFTPGKAALLSGCLLLTALICGCSSVYPPDRVANPFLVSVTQAPDVATLIDLGSGGDLLSIKQMSSGSEWRVEGDKWFIQLPAGRYELRVRRNDVPIPGARPTWQMESYLPRKGFLWPKKQSIFLVSSLLSQGKLTASVRLIILVESAK
jgi:hypothetical protein